MAHILAIGTHVPKNQLSQESIAENMIAFLGLDAEKSLKLKELYVQTCIKSRHSIIENYFEFFKDNPTTKERNLIYKNESVLLAEKAALEAIKQWGGDVRKITHIISVSCTGIMAPGIEFHLIDKLGLSRNVARVGLNFMGCFGGFNALRMAASIAKEKSENRVLVVCTELCSLHFQMEHPLSNALFSDGASAAIIGNEEKYLWKIEDSHSVALENSADLMTWEIGNQGFAMKLSERVPVYIKKHIKPFVLELLGKRVLLNNCDWAIHPGGKAIIQAIEHSCELNKKDTMASWGILEQYGNMSSATILFVLKECLNKSAEFTIGLGFGPGLSIEGILLKR